MREREREREREISCTTFIGVQPPKFFGGISFKPNIVLSFLDMLEKCFDGELPTKETVRAFSLLLRERAHL